MGRKRHRYVSCVATRRFESYFAERVTRLRLDVRRAVSSVWESLSDAKVVAPRNTASLTLWVFSV